MPQLLRAHGFVVPQENLGLTLCFPNGAYNRPYWKQHRVVKKARPSWILRKQP